MCCFSEEIRGKVRTEYWDHFLPKWKTEYYRKFGCTSCYRQEHGAHFNVCEGHHFQHLQAECLFFQ